MFAARKVTIPEMVDLIAYGGHQTASVNSVGKIRTMDTDGPAGVNSSTLGFFGTGFCSEILIAQTWNVDLAYEASEAMAKEFRDFGVFTVSEHKPHVGRDPHHPERTYEVPAHRVVRFRAGQLLRERVAKGS